MTDLRAKGGGPYAGGARKRYERIVDLTGIEVGTFNPSGPPPNFPIVDTRDVFNIGVESPEVESEDWTIYAVPQLPGQWWFTLDDVQSYQLARCPFWLEVDAGVGVQKQRWDIPYQGIAIHLCAAELRIAFRSDPGFVNLEVPPKTFVDRKVAVWARRGRPTVSYLPISTGQNVQGSNVVETPTFMTLLRVGGGGAYGEDRSGVQTFANTLVGAFGISWLTAAVGAIPGTAASRPAMVAEVVQ